MTGMWVVVFVIQWILLLLLTILVIGSLRYLGLVQKNIHLVTRYASRFEEGDCVSSFQLSDLNGLTTVSETLLKARSNAILFFLSTGCSGCDGVVRQIADLARSGGGLKRFEWSFIIIYIGSPTLVKALVAPVPIGEATILVDEVGAIPRQYDIRKFPVAIAVNNQGKVIDQKVGNDILRWLPNVLHLSSSIEQPHSLSVINDSPSAS